MPGKERWTRELEQRNVCPQYCEGRTEITRRSVASETPCAARMILAFVAAISIDAEMQMNLDSRGSFDGVQSYMTCHYKFVYGPREGTSCGNHINFTTFIWYSLGSRLLSAASVWRSRMQSETKIRRIDRQDAVEILH